MFYKKTVPKILEYSQENTHVEVLFNKTAGLLHCCKTYILHAILRFSLGKALKNFINFLSTMFKDFQVKTKSKDVSGACKFIKKETLAQVFSYEFCEL